MKRFFVIAFMALVAIACSEEPKQPTIAEQAESYTARVIDLLDNTIDHQSIAAAGGVDKWFNSLDDAKKQEVADNCKQFLDVEKEFAAWREALDEQGKKEYEEYLRSGALRSDMRKVTVMHRLMHVAMPRK